MPTLLSIPSLQPDPVRSILARQIRTEVMQFVGADAAA